MVFPSGCGLPDTVSLSGGGLLPLRMWSSWHGVPLRSWFPRCCRLRVGEEGGGVESSGEEGARGLVQASRRPAREEREEQPVGGGGGA